MKEDNYVGCGLSAVWATDEKDPFFQACKEHDRFYDKDSVTQKLLSRKQVDKRLLARCLEIAGSNKLLVAKAYLYYRLARALGWLCWEGKK